MIVSVEILNEDALKLLQDLERLKVLKLFLPSPKKSAAKKNRHSNGSSTKPVADFPNEISARNPHTAEAEAMPVAAEKVQFKAGFGGAKGMFVMSPDFDEPLEDMKEYMY